MNKQELLDLTRSQRQALDDTFATRTEDELCAPVLDGGRSIKDTLAHITAWERRLLTAIVTGKREGSAPWPEPGATMADMDRLNDRDFLANRDRRLADVVSDAHATYDEIIALIEASSEAEIAGELPFTPGIPLESVIRANADEHYREHLDAIEAWRAGRGA